MRKPLAALTLCVGLAACGDGTTRHIEPADYDAYDAKERLGVCRAHSYGSGVYYIPCRKAEFAHALAKFLTDNPGLRVTAMSGNGTGGHGRDEGYFVVTEPR